MENPDSTFSVTGKLRTHHIHLHTCHSEDWSSLMQDMQRYREADRSMLKVDLANKPNLGYISHNDVT
jgi:hypothetical protein